MLTIVYLLISLIVVSLAAELLVRSASFLAMRAGVSPLFVGLTIVGFGTSSPELGASVSSTIEGLNDVSVGNVIGSNIFNVAFILGITALICPIRVRISAVRSDLKVAIFAALIPFASLLFGGKIPGMLGVFMVCGLVAYIVKSYLAARKATKEENQIVESEVGQLLSTSGQAKTLLDSIWLNAFLAVAALVVLVVGSKVFVENAVILARALKVSDLVIGLTVVSVGTSLPELITSVLAARKRNADLAIGNVIGSNIFNLLGVLGICAAINPQTVSSQTLLLDAPVMLLTTLAMLPIMKSGGCISRREGGVLLCSYFTYLFLVFWFS